MAARASPPAFGLIANTTNTKAMKVAGEIFRKMRGDLVVEKATATALGVDGVALGHMEVDVLIAVGGDGTVLRALQQNSAKILGLNAGVLGFLTECRAEEHMRALDLVRAGRYRVESCLKLRAVLNGKALFDCTNEAVLHTVQIAKMGHFRISIDGVVATQVRADGVIIATPTGSTSYSLSLGGPLIDPKVQAFVIAPMAPFKLSTRPIVVPSGSKVEFRIIERNKPCALVLDGQHSIEVGHADRLEFTRAKKPARFIRFGGGFYRRIEEKLKF